MMTALTQTMDIVGAVLAVLGASLMAISAIGLHRYVDPTVRLHVAAKASSAGVLALLVGVGLRSGSLAVGLELALTGLFLLVTVPLATHGLARAVLRPDPPPAADGS